MVLLTVTGKKNIDKSYSWLPYALGGALLALLMIFLSSLRQKESMGAVENKSHDQNR